MFRFIKPIFVSAMMLFGCNLSSMNPLECVSMKNQECKVRSEIVNVNSNEPLFYPFSISENGKLCVPDVVKNINIKGFNLMSRTNETRHKMA